MERNFCIICKEEEEDKKDNTTILFHLENCKCSLYYCRECLSKWLDVSKNYKCVYCFSPISTNDIKRLKLYFPDIEFIIRCDNLELFKIYLDLDHEICYTVIKYAVYDNSIKIIQYLRSIRIMIKYTEEILDVAVCRYNWRVMKFLHSLGVVFTTPGMEYMMKNYEFEQIRTVYSLGLFNNTNIMNLASEYGRLDVVVFIYSKDNPHIVCTQSAMDNASKNGHYEVVKFLHSIGAKCSKEAIGNASMNGNVNIVRFLYENKKAYKKYAIDLAMKNGHTEIVNFLREYDIMT